MTSEIDTSNKVKADRGVAGGVDRQVFAERVIGVDRYLSGASRFMRTGRGLSDWRFVDFLRRLPNA